MKLFVAFLFGLTFGVAVAFAFLNNYLVVDKKEGVWGFSEGIPQKQSIVPKKGIYHFKYDRKPNQIITYKNNSPFVLEGDGNIFGIFDEKGLIASGDIGNKVFGDDIEFVFFTDEYVYVFDWNSISGVKYKRNLMSK